MTLYIVESGTTEDLDTGRNIPKVVSTWEAARRLAYEDLMVHLEASTDESEQVATAAALEALDGSFCRFSAALAGFEVDIAPVGSDPDFDFDSVEV